MVACLSSVMAGGFVDAHGSDDVAQTSFITESDQSISWTNSVGSEDSMGISSIESLTIDSVSYESGGVVSFKGKASSELVNLRVTGEEYASVIDACPVRDGCYSDSILIGDLKQGRYSLTAMSEGSVTVKTFDVTPSNIIIDDASYDPQSKNLNYSGSADVDVVYIILEGDGGFASPIDACLVEGGVFSGSMYVGELGSGTYRIIASYGGTAVEREVEVDGDAPVVIPGLKLSSDGTVLEKFTGSVDVFKIPSSVVKIADGAFSSCSIGEFVLDRDLTWEISVADCYPFEKAGLKSIIIDEGVSAIPDYIFAKTCIESITIPSSVKTIGLKAFYSCEKLSEVVISDGSMLVNIGDYSFSSNPSLETVTFGTSADGVECTIQRGAFLYDDRLVGVTMKPGSNITVIEDYAFAKSNNDGVLGVNINSDSGMIFPKSVRSIGFSAFSYAKHKYALEPNTNTLPENNFDGSVQKIITMSAGATISFEQGSNLGLIGDYAFAGYSGVSSSNGKSDGIAGVDLSPCIELTDVGKCAFRLTLTSIAEIKLSHSIENIGDYAFYNGLPKSDEWIVVNVPASVETVGKCALSYADELIFDEGSHLRSISLQDGLKKVDLHNCFELELDEALSAGSGTTKLPPGVYERGRIWYACVDESTPIALLDDDDVLLIQESTVAIAKESLRNAKGIVCDPNNRYFLVDDNILYFTDNDETRVVLIFGQSDVVHIREDVVIGAGVIQDDIRELVMEGEVSFSEEPFGQSSSIKSLVFGTALNDLSWQVYDAFHGLSPDVCYHVMDGSSPEYLDQLDAIGRLFVGYADSKGNVVFVPYSVDGKRVECSTSEEGGVLEIRISADILQCYDVVGIGCSIKTESDSLIVQSVDGRYSKLVLTEKNSAYLDEYIVIFDGDGGDCNGNASVVRTALFNQTLAGLDIPSFVKPGHRFVGWSLDGVLFDQSQPIGRDMILKAVWEARKPVVSFENDAAIIDCGELKSGTEITDPQKTYTFKIAEINPGYEVFSWIVNGKECGSATQELTIAINEDTTIGVSYRYYAPSSGLNPISNRDLPSAEEITNLVKSYTLGGYLDNSGKIWKGHASVPLIIDDRVYFRAGAYLYVAESDTGYIINYVNSVEPNEYYHHLGYGDGVIIDCFTRKAYNTDLEQIFVIGDVTDDGKQVKLTGVEFNDGWFYTSGSMIYRFSSNDDNVEISDEVKSVEFVGEISGTFGSYGFTHSIFIDKYLYRIVTDGIYRGVAGIDLETKEVKRVYMPSLNYMYLDDGWMTYHDGYLYLTAYSQGLFGAVATFNNGRMAYVSVNGLDFGGESYYEFEDGGFTSQFVVVDGIGYVNCSEKLYMFDMSIPGTPKLIGTGDSSFGHGSIAIDTSDIDMDGSPVYIYMIPYDSNVSSSFCLVEAIGEGSDRKLIRHEVSYLPKNYNSQTVRADIDGRMIWYNDSGHIYTYTTEEKNPFFFFIEKNGNAMWYESYGKTAADALSRLGRDVVTLNDSRGIGTLFGHSAESSKIWVLESKASQTQIANLKNYGWTEIPNLYDSAYDVYHYYVIRADGTTGVFEEGTEFSFYVDDEVRSYKFRMNIGEDRGAIGIQMVLGNDLSKIRIYDDSGKLVEEYTGRIGTETNASFPDFVNPGKVAQWMLSDTVVAELRGQMFVSGGSDYRLKWVDEPVRFDIKSSIIDNGETVSISYTLDGRESGVDMALGIYVICSDGSVLNREIDIVGASSSGAFDFETAGVDSYYLKVYMKGQNDVVIEDFGHYLYKAEASA